MSSYDFSQVPLDTPESPDAVPPVPPAPTSAPSGIETAPAPIAPPAASQEPKYDFSQVQLDPPPADAARQALKTTEPIDPEREANTRKLADLLGISEEEVRHVTPEAQRNLKQQATFESLHPEDNAGLVKWLGDPRNAALARDDLHNLSAIERAWNDVVSDPATKFTTGLTVGLGKLGLGGAAEFIGEGMFNPSWSSGFQPVYNPQYDPHPGMSVKEIVALDKRDRARAEAEARDPINRIKNARPPANAWEALGQVIAGTGEQVAFEGNKMMQEGRPDNPYGAFLFDALSSVTTVAAAAGATALAGPGAGAAVMGTIFGGVNYAQGHDMGLSPGENAIRATLLTVPEFGLGEVTVGLLRTPMKAIGAKLPEFVTRVVGTGAFAKIAAIWGIESFEEGATQALQIGLDNNFYGEHTTLADALGQILYATATGGVGGIAIGGPMTFIESRSKSAREAQRMAASAQQLPELVKAALLQQRSPEAMATFMQNVRGDGNPNVGIPLAAFNKYAESKGVTPEALLQELGGDPIAIQRATMSSGDVMVPYATLFQSADHATALLDNVRLKDKGMTKAEADEWLKTGQGEATAKLLEKQAPQAQAVYDDAIKIATEGNLPPAEATKFALLQRHHYGWWGVALNEDPMKLWQEKARTIKRSFGVEADAAALAQRAAEQATPEFKAWFGESKVRDKSGKPIVVYHGTKSDIEQFNVGTEGAFFSASPKAASSYAGFADGEGGNVVPAYLSLKNPLIVDDPGTKLAANYYDVARADLQKKAREGGHDGIIVRATRGRQDTSTYVVFNPEQIKSVFNERPTDDPNILKQKLPTALPTSKKQTADLTNITVPDLANLARDPTQLQQAVDAVADIPGMADAKKIADPMERARHLIRKLADNLLWLHDEMPQEQRDRAKLWYDGAQRIAEKWAATYDMTPAQAAGVLAVLSPQQDWFINVTLAERVVDIVKRQRDAKWNKEMDAVAFRYMITKEAEPHANEGIAGRMERGRAAKEAALGRAQKAKSLGALLDAGDIDAAAHFVRAYDEAHNSAHYAVITPEGGFSDPKQKADAESSSKAWGGFGMIENAISITLDGRIENISRALGDEHKVRNFYNNIFDATDPRFTTIDTHAVGAATLIPYAGAHKAVTDMFGKTGGSAITGVSGSYPIYYEAYALAASERGLLPREMQSVTWESIRSLFTPERKRQSDMEAGVKIPVVKTIEEIWSQVDRGEITIAEARASVAGFIGDRIDPAWLDQEVGTPLRDKTYTVGRVQRAGHRVTFEVAPDPRSRKLKVQWDALTAQQKFDISHSVAWQIASDAMSFLGGIKGELRLHLGGFENDTNPSMSIVLDDNVPTVKADLLSRMLGSALRQKVMMDVGPKKFKGSSEAVAFVVQVPTTGTLEGADVIYQKLRTIVDAKGQPLIGGHTTDQGAMVLIYDPAQGGVAADEMLNKITAVLPGHTVGRDTIWVRFANAGKDSYGLRSESEDSGGPSVREKVDSLRAAAGDAIQRAIAANGLSATGATGEAVGRGTDGLPRSDESAAGLRHGEPGVHRPDEGRLQAGSDEKVAGPDWIGEAVAPAGAQHFSAKPRQADAVAIVAVHYSAESLTDVDPRMAGSGTTPGAERKRFGPGTYGARGGNAARSYFYAQIGSELPTPEDVVPSNNSHGVVLDNLYDAYNDSRGLYAKFEHSPDDLEAAISEAGFDGMVYRSRVSGPVAVVFDVGDATVPVVPIARTFSQSAQTHEGAIELSKEPLSPEHRAMEIAFSRYLQDNFEEAEQRYADHPETDGGRILSADIIRELSDDYLANRGLSQVVQEPSSWFVKELYKRRLKEEPKPGQSPMVLFTAGSTGAGKTTSLQQVAKMRELNAKAQIVYDYNMNTHASAVTKIEQALAAGKFVRAVLIDRDPVDALVNGALPRAMRQEAEHGTGRTVPLEAHIKTGTGAVETLQRLAKEYAGNQRVAFFAIDNSRGKHNAVEMSLADAKVLDYNDVAPRVRAALEKEHDEGRISDAVYRGFRVGESPEGDGPAGDVRVGGADQGRAGQIDGLLRQEHRPVDGRVFESKRGSAGQEESDGVANRGQVKFGAGTVDITIFESGDESTIIHELMHTWLEDLREYSQRKGAPQWMKDDWIAAKEFGGFKDLADDAPIPRDMHEKLAEGGETFFREGKAPIAELQPTFDRFKTWFLSIFKGAVDSGVKINPKIREVYSRMLASQESIDQAQQEAGLMDFLFATADDMGMSQAVFNAYRKVGERAHSDAIRKQEKKVLGDIQRRTEQWWKDEEADTRAIVEEEVNSAPGLLRYRLTRWLTQGQAPEGVDLGPSDRLSGAILKQIYKGEPDTLAALRRLRVYREKGGLDPATVATDLFGYDNVSQMVDDLVNNPAEKDWVNQQVQERMAAKHGDFMADRERMVKEALDAIHSDLAGDVLAAELKALHARVRAVNKIRSAHETEDQRTMREARDSMAPIEAFRAMAAAHVAGMTPRELEPHAFLRDEQHAGNAAIKAFEKKNYAEAYKAKAQQIYAHHLYRESIKARDEMDALEKFAKKLAAEPMQKKLGLAGDSYRDNVNGLLDQFEFKKVSGVALDRRGALAEFAKEQEDAGNDVAISPELLADARQVNYRQVKIDELRALHDALKNIVHLAQLKNSLVDGARKVEFANSIDELATRLRESYAQAKPYQEEEVRTLWENVQGKLQSADASLVKIEQLLAWMDNGEIDGPWQRLIFRPLAAAQTNEMELTLKYMGQFQKLLTELTTGKDKIDLTELYPQILAIGDKRLTYGNRLMVALHAGNESNYQRLRDGFAWTDDQVKAVLDTLTDREWKFVTDTWEAVGAIYPEAAAMQKRLTGLPPDKIEPWSASTPMGTYLAGKIPGAVTAGRIGGYVPAKYSRAARVGEKQIETDGKKLFPRAATARSWSKKRAAKVVAPLSLNLSVLPQHLSEVVHDITHREAIQQANRILNNDTIRNEIIERIGLPYHNVLNSWLQSVASDRQVPTTGAEFWENLASGMRTNMAIVAMGFKVTTTLNQLAGVLMSTDVLGANGSKYLAKAMVRFMRNPIDNFRAGTKVDSLTHAVFTKSGEMRHRARALEINMRDAIRKAMGKDSWTAKMQRHAFDGVVLMDRMVTVPTWWAAYEQAIKQKMSEADAIASGDRAVRLSQGAGGAKDLSAIQNSNELVKNMNLFYSFFNVLYSRLRDIGHAKAVGADGFATTAIRSFLVVALAGILAELLSARPPADDEEKWLWALRITAMQGVGAVPFARSIADSVKSGFGVETPQTTFMDKITGAVRRVTDVAQGEREPQEAIAPLVDAAGMVFGLPTGQAKITGKYLWDLWTGDESPETPVDFVHDILFRRPKE